jgi:hypothetical protein
MPKEIERLLEEIGAANSDEVAAIAAEIEDAAFEEHTLGRLTDAIREARERIAGK